MIRICVIDDNPLILTTVKRALAREGYEVFTVSDKEGFSQVLERERFDLVITDFNLKDCTGLDIRDELLKRSASTRIIVMTGKEIPQGIDIPFIRKPFSIKELRSLVAEILRDEP